MAAATKPAAKTPWLHAWRDPVADLKAYSPCIRLVDLNGARASAGRATRFAEPAT